MSRVEGMSIPIILQIKYKAIPDDASIVKCVLFKLAPLIDGLRICIAQAERQPSIL
jgi:hypothetical protein